MTTTHASGKEDPAGASANEAVSATPIADAIVDVGIPTLGTSPYLAESVESVLAQTLESWRLTISENGPGLESVRRAVAPYLDDPRVRHVVRGTKVGRGASHNLLIRAGTAPYVGVLHDDDRWHPEFLERRAAFLDEHPTCGFVYSGHVVIDETGKPVGRTKLALPAGVHRSAEILPPLYRNNFIGCPTVLVRRTAYEAVGSEYKDILNYDIPMWLSLAATFDVGCLEAWDADYRHHGGQASANRTGLAKEMFPVLDAVSDLPISPSLQRLVRAETHVRCALDAVERGAGREAVGHLRHAVRTDPLSLVRPTVAGRMIAALGALAGGERGRRALSAARDRRWHAGGAQGLQHTVGDARR